MTLPTLLVATLMQRLTLTHIDRNDLIEALYHIGGPQDFGSLADSVRFSLRSQFPDLWSVVKDVTQENLAEVASQIRRDFPETLDVQTVC